MKVYRSAFAAFTNINALHRTNPTLYKRSFALSRLPSVRRYFSAGLCPNRPPFERIRNVSRVSLSCSAANELQKSEILDAELRKFYDCLSDERAERVATVLQERTRHLTIVLEEVLGPHNCAAVLRTADAFGIQDVHFIRSSFGMDEKERERKVKRPRRNTPESSKVSKGADNWLTLKRHKSPQQCVERLRKAGYRIYVSSLAEGAKPLEELPFNKKTALIYGNEVQGVSEELTKTADERFVIRNVGFVDSYNISVAVAITLSLVSPKCRREVPTADYELTLEEKREILRKWLIPTARARSSRVGRTPEKELATAQKDIFAL